MKKFDLIVIGSGPGGYVAAIRAAQRGLKVACVEKEKTLGGTCLNVGCIPSKALLHSTEYFHKVAAEGKEHGIEAKELTVNLSQMMKRKEKIVTGLVGGIGFLFKKNNITSLQGEARLVSPTQVSVGSETYEAAHILLATGSEPIPLPFLPFDEKKVLSSTGALSLPKVPKKLLMVGAGVIGLELGSVYQRLGTEVEVVELLDRVAPPFDRAVSKELDKILTKQGMKFHLSTKVVCGAVNHNSVELTLDSKETLTGDVVLVAIGRRPYSSGLDLEKVGVQTDKQGRVQIDQSFCTSVPTIFAIGDLVDGPMLAHKASEEGIAAVDLICGDTVSLNYLAIPNVMYTWPEVACVGMTEEEAKEAGLSLRIGKIPFKAIPRARCSGDEEGFVKVIGEKQSDRLVGMHIVGPSASEMIHEGVLALQKRATLSDIAHASHAHPTCSEAIKEAALAAHSQAIHA
ncbi:MAG: Dihydrolipoyl dehydrogenase 3 [Chlamydiales bacterium]|nr:Dihydrolipoyl dehydrogenase 3 [Chlamydiales bacterium]